jgi:hypothetical protein
VDGALYVLLATGHLRATDASGQTVDAKSLDRSKLTQASFRRESITITPPQKIKIRTLFTALGVACQPGEELAKVPQLIAKLRSLASNATGPAPAPAAPDVAAIDAVDVQSGNGQLLELFTRCDELSAIAKGWEKTAKVIQLRQSAWKNLMRLLAYANGLEAAASIQANADAIVAQRGLLDEPDPVSPLLDAATNLLRQELNAKLKAYAAEHKRKMEQLEAHEDWQKLSWVQLNQLVEKHQLAPLKTPELHTSALLLDALDDCNLHHWADRIAALSGRFEAARQAATRLLKPNAFHVKLPGRTINNAEELKQWLTEVEALVAEQLKKGPVSL